MEVKNLKDGRRSIVLEPQDGLICSNAEDGTLEFIPRNEEYLFAQSYDEYSDDEENPYTKMDEYMRGVEPFSILYMIYKLHIADSGMEKLSAYSYLFEEAVEDVKDRIYEGEKFDFRGFNDGAKIEDMNEWNSMHYILKILINDQLYAPIKYAEENIDFTLKDFEDVLTEED